ncbi:uncharacterized protein [Magallana gigas]
MLDKKKENSMILCLHVNETMICFVSTCTCPNSRTRRSVNSHLLTPNPSSGPQEATCKLELILSENISDNRHGNMTIMKDERYRHPMECTTLKCETKKNNLKNKVLVQSECSPVSSKNTPADTPCNHPSKKDFGLEMNGSVRESLKTLPKIIAGFLSVNNSDQEAITFTLKDCIRSQDCRIYTMLDKKKENTLTLCVVVNETKNCFVSTCTCPNSRTRRGVNSHLLTPNPSSGPQDVTCKLELILSENISDNLHGNMTNLRDERSENPMDCTTLKRKTKKNTLKNEGLSLPGTCSLLVLFPLIYIVDVFVTEWSISLLQDQHQQNHI